VLALVGGVGLSLLFSAFVSQPALAGPSYVHPAITSTKSTFKVPVWSTSTWTLRLWAQGTLEGSDTGKSGTLVVVVPHTSACAFQADVSETPLGGRSVFYSGARATMTACGVTPPIPTIAGHIYLCTPAGATTIDEVLGGTVSATGPQTLASQANPLNPTSVASGTYEMTADFPTGYLLVACGGTATVASGGLTASQSVTATPAGTGVGLFYASAPPAGGGGGGSSGSSGSTGSTPIAGATSSSGSTGPTSQVHAATAAGHSAAVQAVAATGSSLAFTGMDAEPPLLIGLILFGLGLVLTAWSRVRRSGRRQPVRVQK